MTNTLNKPKRRPYNASGSLSEYGIFPDCDAAWDAVGAAAMGAWAAAEDAIRADFERMLAAHHAMPGESCALVDW